MKEHIILTLYSKSKKPPQEVLVRVSNIQDAMPAESGKYTQVSLSCNEEWEGGTIKFIKVLETPGEIKEKIREE